MTTPVISLISAAARPENWLALYENVAETDVKFEIVFVGPNAPKRRLPVNCRYIKSNVKPTQAYEIAARHAEGSLLMWTSDDILFTTKRPLDRLYEVYTAQSDQDVIVSCEYDRPEGWNRLGQVKDNPEMPLNGLLSAKLWHRLGGIDRRFIAVNWETDMTLRLLGQGGRVVMSGVYIGDEIEQWPRVRSRGGSLMKDYGATTDGDLIFTLWERDGKLGLVRSLPVERFPDETILTRSEHPQGRWRYEGDRINKFLTSSWFHTLNYRRRLYYGKIYRMIMIRIPSYIGSNKRK